MSFRTDIAHEAHSVWKKINSSSSDLEGVTINNYRLYELQVSKLEILSDSAAGLLNKAKGKYYTVDLPPHFSKHSDCFDSTVHALSDIFLECMTSRPSAVLVSALGNADITPDALGPLAADSVLVTKHLVDKRIPGFEDFCSVCVCRPGVLGTSGIESAKQIKLLCDCFHPELVFVIDAFACCEHERLCRTIQVSDTGISPGSGVGNDREELSHDSLGVRVLSVGMPTVIDAGSFGIADMSDSFVTPRSIDCLVRDAGKIIGTAVNMALHPQLSIDDILAFTD